MELPIELQRQLVQKLLKIPIMQRREVRDMLLMGLPDPHLIRSDLLAIQDLNHIIDGLKRLGRLDHSGGTRPLIVVMDNALQLVPPTGEVAEELQRLKQELERYYGGESSPPLSAVAEGDLEALLFDQRDDRLPFAFIEAAIRTARSVARLTVPRFFDGRADGKSMYGTGWLIAPGLLITNYHVIEARQPQERAAAIADLQLQADQIVIHFDYHIEATPPRYVECRGARLLANDRQLDYALLDLAEPNKVADRHPLPIISEPPVLDRGARLNIVQHSKGGPLQYAIRNNFYLQQTPGSPFIHYQTDTERGASGSPVCDDHWSVVALHRASVPTAPRKVIVDAVDNTVETIHAANEATLLHKIIESLPDDLKQRIRAAQSQP